jgi:hypothetical protein
MKTGKTAMSSQVVLQAEQPIGMPAPNEDRVRLVLRLDVVLYVLLLLFALVLRVAELDTVPMGAAEARHALIAWRAVTPSAAPSAQDSPDSVIVFLAQAVGFALGGGSELSARLPTAIAGTVLVGMPLLFAAYLGRGRVFVLALLLAFSPVLLIASREGGAAVWAGAFAMGFLASLLRWHRARIECLPSTGRAVVAGLCAAGLILCGGVGVVLLAIILGALVLTGYTARQGESARHITPLIAARAFPWGTVLPGVLVALFGAATGFLLYPAGLSTLGAGFAALGAWLGGGAPFSPTAISVTVFYEPHLLVFALIAAAAVFMRRGTAIDRFFAWAGALGAGAALLLGSAPAEAAVWLILPLAGLASWLIGACFAPDDSTLFMPAPGWARWIVAVSLIGVLCAFTIAFQSIARALAGAQGGLFSNVVFPPASLVLLLVSSLFVFIGFFLFASVWGARTTWQGFGLGAAIFFAITSLGSGWAVSVSAAEQPIHVWSSVATARDTALLRATLIELTKRNTRGFPELPVQVMGEQDGVTAWLLRDFSNVRFIRSVQDAIGREVIILPAAIAAPELGGGYVGQRFIITRTGQPPATLLAFPAWWTQRLHRSAEVAREEVVLWLRQDIYAGVSPGR